MLKAENDWLHKLSLVQDTIYNLQVIFITVKMTY